MEKLRTYLNGLTTEEQERFAAACQTTVGYLRKVLSTGQALGDAICVRIEAETKGLIACDELRPDIHWVRVKDRRWPNPAGRPLVDHANKAAA